MNGRRRWLAVGGVVLAAALLWLGLGWGGERRDEAWERIQRDGVIRVGMDASFPPFEVVTEAGEFVGYDVDLARELARHLGAPRVEFVNIHFDGLYDALLDAKCDIILSALPFDREMTEDVVYSTPYFHAGQVLLAAEARPEVAGLESLEGGALAVELGSEAHYLARQWAQRKGAALEIRTALTAQEALDLLGEGQVDAAIVDAVTALQALGARQGLRPVGEQLTDEPYVIAAPLGSDILLDRLNRALASLREAGLFETLEGRWF